jgi:(2R)-ethylmalonyl-CoA mutase
LYGTVQNDMLKEFVARGASIFSPETSLRLSSDLITFTANHVPRWNPVNCCGYHYAESGARPQEEIGYTFGNALILLDTVRQNLSKDVFEVVVRRISFFINSGIELVPEICKVRAYARLWPLLCREEFGIHNVAFRAGCQVRSLSLPPTQPENNIVRIALEALPVLLSASARVHALQLPGFREALALPDRAEQTLSLRTQQILMHETKITEYADIFEGNRVIEGLTGSMMQDARSTALEVRSAGYEGAINSIGTRLTRAIVERQHRIDSRMDIIVGLNEYLEPVGLLEQPPGHDGVQNDTFAQKRINNMTRWRGYRDMIAWNVARDRLQAALRTGENIMGPTIELARARGTVGEWTSIIESVSGGRYNVPVNLDSIGSDGTGVKVAKRTRIVLGKAGLDGHTNAVKVLAIACRNAGMEVIYSGIKSTPAALIKTAMEENADILGVSCLSGAHLKIAEEILTMKRKLRLSSLKFIIGGTIPEADTQRLMGMGVDLVVSPGASTIDSTIRQIASLTNGRAP